MKTRNQEPPKKKKKTENLDLDYEDIHAHYAKCFALLGLTSKDLSNLFDVTIKNMGKVKEFCPKIPQSRSIKSRLDTIWGTLNRVGIKQISTNTSLFAKELEKSSQHERKMKQGIRERPSVLANDIQTWLALTVQALSKV